MKLRAVRQLIALVTNGSIHCAEALRGALKAQPSERRLMVREHRGQVVGVFASTDGVWVSPNDVYNAVTETFAELLVVGDELFTRTTECGFEVQLAHFLFAYRFDSVSDVATLFEVTTTSGGGNRRIASFVTGPFGRGAQCRLNAIQTLRLELARSVSMLREKRAESNGGRVRRAWHLLGARPAVLAG